MFFLGRECKKGIESKELSIPFYILKRNTNTVSNTVSGRCISEVAFRVVVSEWWWFARCRSGSGEGCRCVGGNGIRFAGGLHIRCRLWLPWWYSGLSSRCRTGVGLYIWCRLCGSPPCYFGTMPIAMLLLSIGVFSFFFFKDYGQRTTDNGRAKPFFF